MVNGFAAFGYLKRASALYPKSLKALDSRNPCHGYRKSLPIIRVMSYDRDPHIRALEVGVYPKPTVQEARLFRFYGLFFAFLL